MPSRLCCIDFAVVECYAKEASCVVFLPLCAVFRIDCCANMTALMLIMTVSSSSVQIMVLMTSQMHFCELIADVKFIKIKVRRSVVAGFGRHGMPPPASDTDTASGRDGSDWSRDLPTLTFDVGGHGACGWCGSSSSIRVPSLKFVGLAVWKIWRTAWCVSISGPGDLDLWTLKLVRKSHQRWVTFFPNLDTLGLRVLELFATYATDGQTDGQKQHLLLPSLQAGA